MTLQQLEYFQSVAQSASFTKAARKHFVSQTAISRQVQQLEQELKVSLLERNTASVRLTAAGRYFYEETLKICENLRDVVEQTQKLDYENHAHLSLGIPGIVETHAVSGWLRAFRKKRPDVAVRFVAASRQELVTLLVQGRVDLLIAQDHDLPELKGLAVTVLSQDYFAWMLPSNHPLAGRSRIAPKELAGETLLLPGRRGSSTSEAHLRYYRLLGLEKNPCRYTDGPEDVSMLLGAGYGIGLTPSKESPWLKPDMCCVEIDGPRCEVKILAITRPENSNPNIQAFL